MKMLSTAMAILASIGAVFSPAQTTAKTAPTLQEASQPLQKSTAAQAPKLDQQVRRALFREPEPTVFKYPAPGWSVAHDRRMAKKHKSVAKNRRAHRA